MSGLAGLVHLIAEAQGLAGAHPCQTFGHDWHTIGGRVCSVHGNGCSEPVDECARCGAVNYDHQPGECTVALLGIADEDWEPLDS